MKINHRHYILIVFAVVSVAASIFCYVFLYKQTLVQANNYLTQKQRVEQEKTSVNYEQTLIDTFNKYKDDRDIISTYIVKEENLVGFIEQVEKVGKDSGTLLELSSISSGDGKIKAKVTAEGNWKNVMKSLKLIENLPLSLMVSNVRLDTNAEGDPKEVKEMPWRLSLDIEVLTTK